MEAWGRLGRIQTAEVLFAEASLYAEEQRWRGHLKKDPHGELWHTSFHLSQFPAGDPRACARKILYSMMGIPEEKPASRMLMGTAVMGQAAEDWNAANLDLDGRLLTPPPTADHQMRLEDSDHWISGSPDMIVLPKYWNRPHLIETKTKDLDVVEEMKNGYRAYDAQHSRQARAYLGFGNRIAHQLWPKVVICRETWRLALTNGEPGDHICRDHGTSNLGTCLFELELQPMRDASLIYMGRNRPHVTASYFFEHDEDWFLGGLKAFAMTRQLFENDELPKHPFGGKDWSVNPCKYCDYKKMTCKPDHKAGVTKLSETKGAEFAREVYGGYSVDEVREAVFARWRDRFGVSAHFPKTEDPGAALVAA